MPPVTSSQGSRTALVTWSVIFAILFVTMAIFAIYFYADASKANERADTLTRQYKEIAQPGDLAGEAVTQLRESRGTAPEGSTITANTPLLSVAVTQRDDLAKL